MNSQMPNDPGNRAVHLLMEQLAPPLEAIANLIFLGLEEAEHPEKVRLYMRMAEGQMVVIRQRALEILLAAR